jgi:PAS domain S-box-containing protein
MMEGKIRILHVDENVSDRKLIRDVLEKEHNRFDLIEADSGKKFIKYLSEDKFDLVLSDINIMELDGLQVIQVVQERDPNLPVIIITRNGSEEIAIRAMKAGASDYVIKSEKYIQELVSTINTVLEHKRNRMEQSKVEEALRSAENKHQKLLESMMDGFAFVDMKWNFVNCNRAFEQMLGYALSELQVMTVTDITPPKWHKIEAEIIDENVLVKGYSDVYEKEYIRKDGTIFPIEIRTFLYKNHKGENEGLWAIIRDITIRKHNENELIENEARFRSYFDLSIAGIAITSPDMKWIEVNEYLCFILGYTREELLHRTWAELTHPDDVNLDLASFNKVMKGEIDGYTIDKRFIHKDGRTIWTSLSVKCVRKIDRQVDYFMALLFDISARKQAEETIQKTTSELQLIIKNMLNAFIMWESVFDEKGNYISFRFGLFNDAYATIAKLKPEEVLGKDVFEVWPETEPEWVEIYGKVATTGIPQIFDMYHEPTKGWYHCNAYRPSDSPRMICVIFEDITVRRHMEEKLAWEQYLMNTLMDNIPDHIYFKDLESRFVRVNKSLAKTFGLENPLMAIGKRDADFFDEEHSRKAFSDEQSIIKTGVPLIGKEEIETWPDRPSSWVSTTKMPLINAKGEIIGTFGISRDINDMKKIQNDLGKAKEKAEESDLLKSAFLQNISHEIRTPLNAIVGFSSILANSILPDEKRKEFMNVINISNDQLLSIISGIMALATLESGQEQIVEKETDINILLKSVYDQFSINLSNTDVVLSYHTEPTDESGMVYTDSIKLMQVLINLVGNALKFTHKGFVRFGYRIIGNILEFFVEDSGIGIHEDMHDLIFERFRQVDNSATRKYGGTGLGLALSKGYVYLLGGIIKLSSNPGVGSTFTFTIPYKPVLRMVASEIANPTELTERTGSDKVVLIAEDDTSNYMVVEEMLNSMKIKTIRASNGLEALDKCTGKRPPDIVLMDIKMPIMDGIEATKKIKLSNPNIPILALTAYVSKEERKLFLASGCDGFIEKPVREKDLYNALLKYL